MKRLLSTIHCHHAGGGSSGGDSFVRHRQPAAFSLFELLIVLAILATVSAMAAPQLMSMIREGTVFEAADNIRAILGDARRFAIDTGIDYEVRYEVNGSTVVVLPAELELSVDETQGTSQTIERYNRLALELPETIRIRAAEGEEEASERLEATVFGDLGGNQLAQKSWSTPIMFRFDGTADDFELRVSDERDLTAKVTLRGLTGSARTSQVYQEQD
ncbi:MAG: prepilin-type N-terminal cleavage/methylation domain-containing protein [Fuerstiella sp.]